MPQTVTLASCTLECGVTLREVPVAYESWGTLNRARDNVVVVGHSLTSTTDVTDWWRGCIGAGKALDTSRYFVICANVVGSPYGTIAPVTIDPASGRPYGMGLPQASVRDVVSVHRKLLDRLGVTRIAFVAGGSLGGMQALEWAFYGKDYVRGIVPVGVGGRHSPWCVAWSEAQRQAIYADPDWRDGCYDADRPPSGGLAAARMMAMVSYRSPESFQMRFGRARTKEDIFQVESWLRHHGDKIVGRFDAACYVYLTRLMDTHDVSRGRGPYEATLRQIKQPTLAIGIRSDSLYILDESKELVRHMPNAELAVMEGQHGHDTFLIDQSDLNEILLDWRIRTIDSQYSRPLARSRANQAVAVTS